MIDLSQYQHVGAYLGIDYYLAEADILLILPEAGYLSTAQLTHQTSDYVSSYVRKAGKKFGAAVVMANVLSQDAETRRVFQNLTGNGLYFGLALVVNSGLSRALVSFFMGFTKPPVPTQSFDTIENGIERLKTVRSQ